MLNNYYKNNPDPLYESLIEGLGHSEYFTKLRDYCLDQYSSNLTSFLEQSTDVFPTSFWEDCLEKERSPKDVLDSIACDIQYEHQQRFISNIVLGAE